MVGVQQDLLEIVKANGEPVEDKGAAGKVRVGPPKLKPIDRTQMVFRSVDVERLIEEDHRARVIWELSGQIDLTAFAKQIKSVVGEVGRASWDPRLLVSIWVYGYSRGMTSAREIEREMAYEPGLMWLSGLEVVNHHTLSDFRSNRRGALEEVFKELLAVLESEGLVDLRQVMVDGTKIQVQASKDSFQRGKKIDEHLANAEKVMEQIKEAEKEGRSVREAAQQRAKQERLERLQAARKEYEKLQAEKEQTGKQRPEQKEKQAAALRVSENEAEARQMKHPGGGYAPSYNVQVSTDAKAKIVVGMHLSQDGNDIDQLKAAVEDVKQAMGRDPEQVVADGGYGSRANILAMAEKGIDFISSLASEQQRAEAVLKGQGISKEFYPAAFQWDSEKNCFVCPAGKQLKFQRHHTRQAGHRFAFYRARQEDCQACIDRMQCCPQVSRGRLIKRVVSDQPAIKAFREKMEQVETKEIYKKRAPVSETVNAWIKQKMGLRRFRLRGMAKAGTEMLWACLTYNIMQWIRLRNVAATA